jgi:hypothetical protein
MKGEVADWLILGGLAKQVGDWVDRFVGAQQIANLITETVPIEGQPALRPLEAKGCQNDEIETRINKSLLTRPRSS